MKYLIKNKHWRVNKEYDLEKLLYLLIDRPSLISPYSSFFWETASKRHRNHDLPAAYYYNNEVCWFINGCKHRENNKPAVILENGEIIFYCHDIQL